MWPFKESSLEDRLYKKIRVHGIYFKIKKISPEHYFNGSKVMLQEFATYKIEKNISVAQEKELEKIKGHYRDVFMACVVSPVLTRKPEQDGIFVDHLFTDMELATELYIEIIAHTYQKKNFKKLILQKINS